MKVVFSRKGWDSSAGGWPSPILPDGELLSLPIPFRAGTPLDGLSHPQCGALATLAADLSHGQRGAAQLYHFDPDLRADWAPRQAAWRPAFGQDSAAQRHLSNQGVTRGDVFLFFGWFRKVEQRGGTWAYVRGAPDVHVLFGWLQIGDIVRVDKQGALSGPHPWLATHPHVQFAAGERLLGRPYPAERTQALAPCAWSGRLRAAGFGACLLSTPPRPRPFSRGPRLSRAARRRRAPPRRLPW